MLEYAQYLECACIFILFEMNVESNNNVENRLKALMPSFAVVDFRSKVRHSLG